MLRRRRTLNRQHGRIKVIKIFGVDKTSDVDKDLCRIIWHGASKKYRHHGDEWVKTFRDEFKRLCIKDGIWGEYTETPMLEIIPC